MRLCSKVRQKNTWFSYTDGRVADVNGVVGVRGLDVELQDVVDVGCLDEQGAQTLHHPRLTAQHLKHTAGKKGQRGISV